MFINNNTTKSKIRKAGIEGSRRSVEYVQSTERQEVAYNS